MNMMPESPSLSQISTSTSASPRHHLYPSRLSFLIPVIFILVALVTFFILRFCPRFAPGTILFSDTISISEQESYTSLLSDLTLSSDVTLYRYSDFSRHAASPNTLLLDIFVPVTDFYASFSQISQSDFAVLVSNHLAGSKPASLTLDSGFTLSLISVQDLDSSVKLLAVDDAYFLDTLSTGAVFDYLLVSPVAQTVPASDAPLSPDVSAIISRLAPIYDRSLILPSKDNVSTLAQTGVTALARNLNSKLAQTGDPTYFSTNLRDFLKNFTLVHTSSESSFSSSASGSNICSDPRFLDTLLDLSVDIVELTGNHNLDCGASDALNTISLYNFHGIHYYGGGEDLTAARQPLRISLSATSQPSLVKLSEGLPPDEAQTNNSNSTPTSLTLLAYNESTGGATSGDYPGANPYSEADAGSQIASAKARGDLVIVDVQYYECNAYDNESDDRTCDYADSSAGDQISFFRHLIDLGADVVVGTSAHQPQTFERYKDGEIYYGLGNFLFDQAWWPGTSRSLLLVHYFWEGRLLQTRRFATIYDSNFQPRLMSAEENETFLSRLASARPNKTPD